MSESLDLDRVLRELRARDEKIDAIARELSAATAVAARNEEILDDIREHINSSNSPKALLSWVQPIGAAGTLLGMLAWALWVQPLEFRVEELEKLGESNRARIEAFMASTTADAGP